LHAKGENVPEIFTVLGNHDVAALCYIAMLKDKFYEDSLDSSCDKYLDCLSDRASFIKKLEKINISRDDIAALKDRFGKYFEPFAEQFTANLKPDWISPASIEQLKNIFNYLKELPLIIRVEAEHIEDTFNIVHADLPDDWDSLKNSAYLTPEQINHATWARTSDKNTPKPKNASGRGITYCGHTVVEGIRTQKHDLPIINMDFGTACSGIAMFMEPPVKKNKWQHHLHFLKKVPIKKPDTDEKHSDDAPLKQEKTLSYWQCNSNIENRMDWDMLFTSEYTHINGKARELVLHTLKEQTLSKLCENANLKQMATTAINNFNLRCRDFFSKTGKESLCKWIGFEKTKSFATHPDEQNLIKKASPQDIHVILSAITTYSNSLNQLLGFFNKYNSENVQQKTNSLVTAPTFWAPQNNPPSAADKIEELFAIITKLQYANCDAIQFTSINSLPLKLTEIIHTFAKELKNLTNAPTAMEIEDLTSPPKLTTSSATKTSQKASYPRNKFEQKIEESITSTKFTL
jgi:hypothetical protein